MPLMNKQKRHLLNLDRVTLEAWLADLGEPSYRAGQIRRWVFERGAASFDEMTNLSKKLRAGLADEFTIHASQVSREQRSGDGTVKLLLGWLDGRTSECVLIPDGKRRTACISCQVGCPVRCRFCASGIGGLDRNLSAGEMVEQALRIAALCSPEGRLSNVVFMGLGEPLANYSAVLRAARNINAPDGLDIGARKITISTIGLPTQIRRLASEKLQVTLAISLHAPNDELRAELIPWAEKIPLAEIIDAAREYFDGTGREITLEYLLLHGVNDRFAHARELAHLAAKMRCNVNLLRYNPVPGLSYERPSAEDAHYFVTKLREHGVNAHLRKSRGLDITAACGQLRRAVAARAGAQPGRSQAAKNARRNR
jgi:23S rRNA (adenine2503-C2)-methyltransferase